MDKVKTFIKGEAFSLKKDITKLEYASWWILRAIMVYAAIKNSVENPENINALLVPLNLLATFTVPLVRLILFPKRIVTKLSFRTQTWLNIMIFFGSFLNQGMHISVDSWDKLLHFMSGAVILFIGNEIFTMFLKDGEEVSPLARTFAATGFSYLAMVMWEVFEFFVDYYWPLSSNQGYNLSADKDAFFVAIFGLGAQNEGQGAVVDTNLDMFCAVVGTIPAIIILWSLLKKRENKLNLKNTVAEQEKTSVKC